MLGNGMELQQAAKYKNSPKCQKMALTRWNNFHEFQAK
jgi:hypothetical protein